MHIVVVDPSRTMLIAVTRLLANADHEVTSFACCARATAKRHDSAIHVRLSRATVFPAAG